MSHQKLHRLSAVSKQIQDAAGALARSRRVSPGLGAVWGNFRDKAQRAVHLAHYADHDSEEAVAEIQHASGSAEKAARADLRLDPAVRARLLGACAAVNAMLRS